MCYSVVSALLTDGSTLGSLLRHDGMVVVAAMAVRSFYREMNTELGQCLPNEEGGMVSQVNSGRERARE